MILRNYLRVAAEAGIHARRAILFGSHARGEAHEWSDIDLIVIAPELEERKDHASILKLWELRAVTDSRIEPIPCGEREWETGEGSPILEIARREGIVIAA